MPDEQRSLEPEKLEQEPLGQNTTEQAPPQDGKDSTPSNGNEHAEKPARKSRKKQPSRRIERLFAELEGDSIDPGAPGIMPDEIPDPGLHPLLSDPAACPARPAVLWALGRAGLPGIPGPGRFPLVNGCPDPGAGVDRSPLGDRERRLRAVGEPATVSRRPASGQDRRLVDLRSSRDGNR